MTDAIENDSAPTNLTDDLAAAWDKQVETPAEDATEATEAVVEEEVTDEIQSQIDTATEFFNARKWMESWDTTLRRMLPDLLFYDCYHQN